MNPTTKVIVGCVRIRCPADGVSSGVGDGKFSALVGDLLGSDVGGLVIIVNGFAVVGDFVGPDDGFMVTGDPSVAVKNSSIAAWVSDMVSRVINQ